MMVTSYANQRNDTPAFLLIFSVAEGKRILAAKVDESSTNDSSIEV